MPIQLLCSNPHCGDSISVPENVCGGSGRCPGCGWAYPISGDLRHTKPRTNVSKSGGGTDDCAAIRPGMLFDGRYRVDRALGEGGMGVVFLAFDVKLERHVALKIPYFRPGDHPDLMKRFRREARIAAGFDHPNLCRVYDFGQVGDVTYLTMPFIEGQPLSTLLGDGPLLPGQAAGIVHTLALALAEAHRRGVIHRDLKPSNIMISGQGELIIMDFGIARLSASADSLCTSTGSLLGTPAYMSPEQVEGNIQAIGAWTDTYCLGVILYQLLTGQQPFVGNPNWVCVQIINDDPRPPSELRPGLDPGFDAICLRAMAKRPEGRYPSMEVMAADLAHYLEPNDSQGGRTGVGLVSCATAWWRNASIRSRWLATLAPLMVLMLIGFQARSRDPGQGISSLTTSPPGPLAISLLDGPIEPRAVSPLPDEVRRSTGDPIDDSRPTFDTPAARGEEAGGRGDKPPMDRPHDPPAEPPDREVAATDLTSLRGELLDLYRSADREGRDREILKLWGKIHAVEGQLQKPDNTLIVIVKESRSSPSLTVRYHDRKPMMRKLHPGTIEVLALDGLSPLTYQPYPPPPGAGLHSFPAEFPPPPPPGFGPPPPKGARPPFAKLIKFQSNDYIIEFNFAGGKWTHRKICPRTPPTG